MPPWAGPATGRGRRAGPVTGRGRWAGQARGGASGASGPALPGGFGSTTEALFSAGWFAQQLRGGVMKSPVPDTTPSDCEEGSDCTPLLQHAPRAETGEQLLDRGSSGGRWSQDGGVQRCLGHRGLRTRSPLTAPARVLRSRSGAQGADGAVRPSRAGRKPPGLDRCGPGASAGAAGGPTAGPKAAVRCGLWAPGDFW